MMLYIYFLFWVGEDFVGDPIPFRIDTNSSSQSHEIGIDRLLLNDERFEPRIEAFFLLIMVNETITNPLVVRISSNPALFQIFDNEDSKWSLWMFYYCMCMLLLIAHFWTYM